ncbi:hypothetical protein SUGI_0356320 [Cryptomeria japonica]|uniref:disease resistance RPP13-like protein 4 n=1 Tax=Cryptomeria japonica TaxID=3369 RepID=UPI002408AA87|nr:disease resistance RPP13-like protein 4 [Cryptomeria japonica]GLJ19670.1 hypothetical protein SUGI_0356320 [Cryptomeria japonica]
MAAGLADGVIGKLTEMAVQQLANEATLVVNFTDDFEWLCKKLTYVRGFLTYADGQSAQNELVGKWLQDVCDTAWDAEDIVEECTIYGNSPQSSVGCHTRSLFRYKMGRRIRKVRGRMTTIMQDASELKLVSELCHSNEASSSTPNRGRARKKSSLLESGSKPVAIDSKIQHIIGLLDDPAVPVIAVVGMGGIGKTFLLQHVFKSTKERFEHSIWLSISQTYSVPKLQSDLASKIHVRDIGGSDLSEDGEPRISLRDVVKERVSEVRAAECIHSHLQRSRSLIVLDDVWRASIQDNLIANLGLPVSDNCRCKIVVTTRNREVCRNMNAHIYEMEYLSDEDSWKLFCAHAFANYPQKENPPHLEKIAGDIVKECGKLPLAIKTIAGSLAGKTLVWDWESKYRQLNEVVHRNDRIMQILKLSYDWLPPALKPCFAYFSLFPEDEELDCEYVINLWIGEGFIPQGEEQWNIGWEYMSQFANLCLIDMVERLEEPRIGTKFCKLHDLLFDLAVTISKENKCAFSFEEVFTKFSSRHSGCRRIMLPKKEIDDSALGKRINNCGQSLRTLSLFQNDGIRNIPSNFFASGRVLRVLDLRGTGISSLPESVGNLKLLRVLNLSQTHIRKVPKCVRKLTSLRFLDISGCRSVVMVPLWIGELKCLQHLSIEGCSEGLQRHIPKAISELPCLLILRSDGLGLSNGDNRFLNLEDVGNLIHLQELWINFYNNQASSRSMETVIGQLVKMRSLGLCDKSRGVVAGVVGLGLPDPPCPLKMMAMKDLEHLRLCGFAVPSWISRFPNLRILKLVYCECVDYTTLTIETLPNLMILELTGNESCTELPRAFGMSGRFNKLSFFEIRLFSKLKQFPKLEMGALPCLEKLIFKKLPDMKRVPIGLELLKSLKECTFESTGISRARLREGSHDWEKIKASNPNVTITWKQ